MTIEVEDKSKLRADPARLARVLRAMAKVSARVVGGEEVRSDDPDACEFVASCAAAGFVGGEPTAVVYVAVAEALDAAARQQPDIPLVAQLLGTRAVQRLERHVEGRNDLTVDAMIESAGERDHPWQAGLAEVSQLFSRVGALVIADRRKRLSR